MGQCPFTPVKKTWNSLTGMWDVVPRRATSDFCVAYGYTKQQAVWLVRAINEKIARDSNADKGKG